MKREALIPRPDWPKKMEDLGFGFHSIDGIYWDERACYSFTAAQIDVLETATNECHQMCIAAAQYVIDKKLYAKFAIPPEFIPLIERSWSNDEATLFGRFDFSWDGGVSSASLPNGIADSQPKMLEYNADTPTSLIEASVAQWYWLQEVKPGADQFNSIHEKLIARFQQIAKELGTTIHFTCVGDGEEDLGNLEYLRDAAMQAGTARLNLSTLRILAGMPSQKNSQTMNFRKSKRCSNSTPGNGWCAKRLAAICLIATCASLSPHGKCCWPIKRFCRFCGSYIPITLICCPPILSRKNSLLIS